MAKPLLHDALAPIIEPFPPGRSRADPAFPAACPSHRQTLTTIDSARRGWIASTPRSRTNLPGAGAVSRRHRVVAPSATWTHRTPPS